MSSTANTVTKQETPKHCHQCGALVAILKVDRWHVHRKDVDVFVRLPSAGLEVSCFRCKAVNQLIA